mmetsp:Transcript_7750/g.18563  ORF Transcript_7750/g.18563 Transcript_7750/m.18563 type:complete len:128 (-) Transcript_7750:808-1191(-)
MFREGQQCKTARGIDVETMEHVAIKKWNLNRSAADLLLATRELKLMRLLAASGDFVGAKTAFLAGSARSPRALYIVMEFHPLSGVKIHEMEATLRCSGGSSWPCSEGCTSCTAQTSPTVTSSPRISS